MGAPDPLCERPSLISRYAREAQNVFVARVRIACGLGAVMIPLFVILDVVVYPELAAVFFAIRLCVVVLIAFTFLALQTAFGQRYAATLAVLMTSYAGLAIALMAALAGGGSSPYYAGVNLVILAASVLLPFDAARSLAASAIVIGGYAVLCLFWAGVPDPRLFTGNLFFMGSTALITALSHRVTDHARKREFLQIVALEEAGRHRDEFLANVTHELRTPLAAILGFCDMLADYMPDASNEHRGWLGRIRENALTLYRLIVQLLDFAKLDAGAMTVASQRVALHPIVTKIAEDMRAIAGNGGVAVDVDIPGESPTIAGDAERVEEIVTNLAANALKFSAGKPIKLVVTRTTIDGSPWDRIVPDPGPTPAPSYAEVAVIDRGDGIRGEDLRRLFVAFQQLDGSSTRRQGGTGLGLAISARLAAAMSGHIAVRSTPGEGSTFAFLAPLAAEQQVDEPR